jgi:hypothetical protein
MLETGNKGEWAEVAAKCHYLINGSFPDGLTGKMVTFDGMWNGEERVKPMPFDPARYPSITQKEAATMLEDGIDVIAQGQGRSFENQPLRDLCVALGIKKMKAHSHEKPDIILYNGRAVAAYFIENPSSSLASFVNASPTTRITYQISRADRHPLSSDDQTAILERYGMSALTDGHRKVKTRVQSMKKNGLAFSYHSIANQGFRTNTQDIGWRELGCLCMDYLSANYVATLGDVLNLHKEHTDPALFKHTRNAFLGYIRESILERGPSQGRADPTVLPESEGMIFLIILEKSAFRLYKASSHYWWEDKIEKGARFDTPDSFRHDYGYAYKSVDGAILFDYALGIRGTFKAMIDKED